MTFPARKKSTVVAAIATAGIAGLFLGVAPASATPASVECGSSAVLIPGNICERVFTSGTETFTPTASMSQLEVLLVAGGGDGANPNINGYAAGGGGGQVTLVGFGASTPTTLTLTVGGSGAASSVSDGTTTTTAAPGISAVEGSQVGGASGSGNPGASGSLPIPYGAGGGAGASPVDNATGGAGVIVSSLAAAGSVFSNDTDCFGGGGAVGISGTAGTATCGGGQPVDTDSLLLIAPTVNSGGGGGGISVTAPIEQRGGASGLVVLRWIPLVTVSFVDNGHGGAIPPQTFVAGGAPVKPVDPTETGWLFNGWFTDAALTVPADFTAPVIGPTTFFASWSPVLAATGGASGAPELPIGIAALAVGAGLFGITHRRRVLAN